MSLLRNAVGILLNFSTCAALLCMYVINLILNEGLSLTQQRCTLYIFFNLIVNHVGTRYLHGQITKVDTYDSFRDS